MDGSQEEGGNFLNLLQNKGITQKGRVPSEKGGGVPTLEVTMRLDHNCLSGGLMFVREDIPSNLLIIEEQ